MILMFVFLCIGFIGVFIVIVVIYFLGFSVGYSGNGYDLGGFGLGFVIGMVIEIICCSWGLKILEMLVDGY